VGAGGAARDGPDGSVMQAAAGRDRPEFRGEDRPALRGDDRQPLLVWEELVATAAGAALAAFLLSRLGVAGTIVGATITPVIITVTNATLSPHIRYARERAASVVAKPRESWWRQVVARLPRGRRLARALLTAAAAFAIVAATMTIAEALVGKPVNAWGHGGGAGFTFTGGGPTTRTGVSTSPTGASTTPTGASTTPTGASNTPGLTQTQTKSQPPPTSSHSSQTTSQPPRSQPSGTTHTAPAARSTATTSSPATTTPQNSSTSNPTGGAPLP
jgi:hypothetical protein